MTAEVSAGFPSYPVTTAKRKMWIRRLQAIEVAITQAGATATYRPIGHFEIKGTIEQLEAIRQSLARKRVKWEARQ